MGQYDVNKLCKKKPTYRLGDEHFHEFEGVTSFSDRHDHEFYGRTIKTLGTGRNHIHRFEGITSFDDGHEHIISFYTGPAIHVDYKEHIHSVEGKTFVVDRHNHGVKGRVSEQL